MVKAPVMSLPLRWSAVFMLSRAVTRAATQAPSVVARRGFHATRSRMSSPFHYPEGPRSNIPFNPKSKVFPFLFWGFMGAGFGIPFGIAAWKQSKAPEA
ncbi:cytochrome-c oxidase chain VIIc [Verticillium dahliae]